MNIAVDLDALKKQMDIDIDQLLLNNVCDPLQYSQDTATMIDYKPRITFYPVPQELLGVLENMKAFSSSSLFVKEWEHYFELSNKIIKENRGENAVMTLKELHSEVWIPASNAIKELLDELKQGSMNLRKAKKIFKRYKNKYRELEEELLKLSGDTVSAGWIRDRVKQIEQFNKMNMYKDGAQQMKNVVDSLGLKGDYKVLDTLLVTVSSGLLLIVNSNFYCMFC